MAGKDVFEFDAPRYFDFSRDDQELDDSYFDSRCEPSKAKKVVQEEPQVTKTTGEEPQVTKATGEEPQVTKTTGEEPQVTKTTGEEPQVTKTTGEEPQVTKVTGEEPQVTKMTGEEPQVTKMTGEEPQVTKTTGEEPQVTKATGEEPQVTKMTGEEPQVTKTTGEEPQVTKATGEEPQVTKMTGEEPQVTKTTGEEPQVTKATGEEPQVTKTTGEEPQVTKTTGEEPQVTKTTGEEPQVTKATGEEPQVTKMTGEEPQDTKTTGEDGEGTEAPQPFTASPGQASASSVKRRGSRKLSGVGVRQSPRLCAISKALRRRSAARRSLSDSLTTSRTQENQVKKVKPQTRVIRKVSGGSPITREDKKELETLATFRQKIANNKRKKGASGTTQPWKPTKPQEFKFATDQRLGKPQVEDPTPAPAITVARPIPTGPTKPREFRFLTDARLKGKEHVKGEEHEAPVEFTRLLRSSSTITLNKESPAGKGPTIPRPFKFSEARRPQAEDSKTFVSMAELDYKYHSRTPTRFKNKRADSTEDLAETKKLRGSTVALTPNLATSRRRRSVSLMSHEQREQQALEEAQKQAFKARPVNRKVLQTPPSGYTVERKLSTVPEPFNITDTKRSRTPLLPEGVAEDGCEVNVSSLPYGGMPIQGKRLTTKVLPFSFDSRDKATMVKKLQKIQKVVEEEKGLAEFHARPMPVFEDGVVGVPARKPPTPTQVKPFALQADQRGAVKQERFEHQMDEESKADAMRRQFHAQSGQVVHKTPFIPEKSQKPLTELSNLTLNTEVKASQRHEYDQQRKMVEEEMLAAKKLDEERRAADQLAEVAQLRKEAVHKAQPMPKFKPSVIQPAPHMPTVPTSPNFATKSRSRANSTLTL